MKQNFPSALAHVLTSEGGFVMNPADPGGMTNLGCTKSTYEAWVGHPVTEQVMRNLKPNDVAPIFKQKYWDKVAGDSLPPVLTMPCSTRLLIAEQAGRLNYFRKCLKRM